MAKKDTVNAAAQSLLGNPEIRPHVNLIYPEYRKCRNHSGRAMAALGRSSIYKSLHEPT